jgi:putative redox protein
VRGHRILVDQPHDTGADTAPTATELFIASLACCVAVNAGWYLVMRGYDRLGLNVSVAFDLAADRPTGVRAISVSVNAPSK